MLRLRIAFSVLFVVMACGGGGGGGDGSSSTPGVPPPEAAALESRLASDMVRVAPLLANIQSSFIFIMNPGTPLAQGVSVVPDTAPGVPPNTYNFSGTYDGNGDGIKETTLSGRVTFGTDPDSGWTSLTGQATLEMSIPLIGHLYQGTVFYSVTSTEVSLSGSGTFTNPVSGTTTTLTVPAGAPLVIKPATGAPDAIANSCGYSLAGAAQLQIGGATGTLSSTWNFLPGSPSVAVQNASFRDSAGQTTSLPDSTADLRCGGSGSINDWVAVFDQQWSCLPRESGRATITIVATGADTISITDQDPPGTGDINIYEAKIVGVSPHAVRGFFISGPTGNQYREDFTWTLRKDGGFSQFSTYTYTEGPHIGSGGICVTSAKRVP